MGGLAIRHKDIASWYDYVEQFAGIQAAYSKAGAPADGKFLLPIALNCVEEHLRKHEAKLLRTLTIY